MGIILCQLRFRRKLIKNGYEPERCLQAAVPRGKRWICLYALIGQGAALVMLAFGEGQQIVFLIACLAILVPALVSVLVGKLSGTAAPAEADSEASFEVKFPPKK